MSARDDSPAETLVRSSTAEAGAGADSGAPRLIGKDAAKEAEAGLREAVRGAFGAHCEAAWLSGSFVYEGERRGRSDVDVVVVLGDETAVPAGGETLGRIRAFVDSYLAVHASCGLDPDLDFPGEFVVPATVDEAIAWRGLAIDGDMAARFAPVDSADYWLGRPDRWFHAWLSMTAFSRFLTGDRAWHERAKLAAWKTVLRFVLLRAGGAPRPPEALLPELAQFGVKPRYRRFWRAERDWLARALAELESEGAVTLAGGLAVPAAGRLAEWEAQVRAGIARGRGDGTLLLPPALHDNIAAHAKRRWAVMRRAAD